MFFKAKKALPSIKICYQSVVVYEGLLKDIPLKESVILRKSIQFFNDPEPCHIHRNAVRLRLTEELFAELCTEDSTATSHSPLLSAYADLEQWDSCIFTPAK